MHELPLVFFTVFTQSAVGAFILLLIGGAMGLVAPRRKAIGLFSVMCLFGLGVIVGTFHVGQPLRALNMLLRVGHSPMSNEIVLSAAFAALGGLGLLVSVLAILVSFCLRPGYMATLMSADSALTAAQHSWFTAQAILLAAGVVGVVVCARLKSSAAVLAMTAVVVIAAELAGRIAFYNLWTLPM
ncbi:dimethyl sulfoxide reductase [Salmonella enterica subsp. enterica serovar Reading]|nr:dimethyl sulfoxide reductase [Salmonella enterica subsp. enterica serovar Reading]ECB8760358.1 dimethyl sulfoxide reductase [Salmonella enterica subsp. enterica serovar Reading]